MDWADLRKTMSPEDYSRLKDEQLAREIDVRLEDLDIELKVLGWIRLTEEATFVAVEIPDTVEPGDYAVTTRMLWYEEPDRSCRFTAALTVAEDCRIYAYEGRLRRWRNHEI